MRWQYEPPLFLHVESCGFDDQVFGSGCLGDGAFDEHFAEALDASEALHAAGDDVSFDVDEGYAGAGGFDFVGVFAASVPRGGAVIVVAHFVAVDEISIAYDEACVAFKEGLAGSADLAKNDGCIAGVQSRFGQFHWKGFSGFCIQ